MKIVTCFLDTTAWVALMNKKDPHHLRASAYFRELLDMKSRLVTNNVELDHAISYIKEQLDEDAAYNFYKVIDESILTLNLRMDWISRRLRRDALSLFLKNRNKELNLKHFYILETVNKKKVDILFSFDTRLNFLGLPVMPRE